MAHEMDEQDLGAPTEASSDEPDTAEADTDAVVVTDTEVPVGSEGRHPEPKLHDWVIVQVDSENKKNKRYYMAVIIEVNPDIKVRFLKHITGTPNVFVNSNIPGDESYEVERSDIVKHVQEPMMGNRGSMVFDIDEVNVRHWPK